MTVLFLYMIGITTPIVYFFWASTSNSIEVEVQSAADYRVEMRSGQSLCCYFYAKY